MIDVVLLYIYDLYNITTTYNISICYTRYFSLPYVNNVLNYIFVSSRCNHKTNLALQV